MPAEHIPRFFLYGEAPQAVGDRFLHLEALHDRARPADWNIRPHSHANLNHVFHVVGGGGEMRAEGATFVFAAPCLLLAPSGVVHALALEPETHGSVLTISESYWQELILRHAALRDLFAAPLHLPLQDDRPFADGLERLARELAWTAPGHAAAVEAVVVTLFVEALRLTRFAAAGRPLAPGAPAALVARFRERVEAGFRSDTPIEAYADALAVSSKQLRSACLRIAGATPLALIQDRLLLEAKRLLLYSNMTVSEAAYYLGFSDPAYFSRFFRKACGMSPKVFRAGSG